MARELIIGLAALAVLGSLVACGGGDSRVTDPHSVEDVQRAFHREGIELEEQSISAEADEWGILLVPTDERFQVEIQIFADGKTARNLGRAFDSFQQPLAGKRRIDLTRQANVLAVAERDSSPDTRRRVERALRHLGSD